MSFFPKQVKNRSRMKTEASASSFLPYKAHIDDKTIICRDSSLMQVVELSGLPVEITEALDLDTNKNLRNNLFKGLYNHNIGLYFHVIRYNKPPISKEWTSSPPDGFAKYLDDKWTKKNKNSNTFTNNIFITIYKYSKKNIFKDGLMHKFMDAIDSDADKEYIVSELDVLNEVSSRLVNSLSAYKPRLLSVVERDDGEVYSELLEFLYQLVNVNVKSKVLLPYGTNVSDLISSQRLYFGKRSIDVRRPSGKSDFACVISAKEYSDRTWAGMLDSLLRLPCEFILSQSFNYINKNKVVHSMQLQQNRMIQADDKATSQIIEISAALDMAISGDVMFGDHHLTVVCSSDSLKKLDDKAGLISAELSDLGIVPVRETVNMEPAFWAQLPGNFDYAVRKATINTMNLSALNSLHNYPEGQEVGNHWGDAVTVLNTASGGPFFFNFHVRDIGHTMIVGPTGSGKTVLMNFLCAQAQKFHTRLFFFDKDRGAEIFLKALNGRYSMLDPGTGCGFNPLQLEDTMENRSFLASWIESLISMYDDSTLSPSDLKAINLAIEGNYKLDKKDRILRNVAPFFGIASGDNMASKLQIWYGRGAYASVFDNNEDLVDFSKSNVFGFEMAKLLADKNIIGPVLLYLFHRINMALDGMPCMIVLDEAWALIDNPIFASKIKDWLKVLRKLNAMVVFATQSVEDATKSDISDTLVQQTATQIFLPNMKATNVYKDVFMINNRELDIIKTTDPSSRYFLLKQGNDGVVARVDLGGMEDIISILSGRASTVRILDDVIRKYGDDPSVWIQKFHQAVENL